MGVGDIYGKVMIEGRVGAADNNTTAAPDTSDQTPGACDRRIRGRRGQKVREKSVAAKSKGKASGVTDSSLHGAPVITGGGDQNRGKGGCGDQDK